MKVVVAIYLRNEFQTFPAKIQASNWFTCWVSQSEAWFWGKWLEFIFQSQIKYGKYHFFTQQICVEIVIHKKLSPPFIL